LTGKVRVVELRRWKEVGKILAKVKGELTVQGGKTVKTPKTKRGKQIEKNRMGPGKTAVEQAKNLLVKIQSRGNRCLRRRNENRLTLKSYSPYRRRKNGGGRTRRGGDSGIHWEKTVQWLKGQRCPGKSREPVAFATRRKEGGGQFH